MLHNSKLDTLIIVSEKLSFNKAANSLFITPSAVTRQIDTLEEEYKIRIFERTPRGLQITPEGKEFIKIAKDIVNYSYEAEEKFNNNKKKNVVRLCNSINTPVSTLRTILEKVKERLPELYIESIPFDVDRSNRFSSDAYSVVGAQYDVILGIVNPSFFREYDNLEFTVLTKTRARIGMSIYNELANKDRLVLSDLDGKTLHFYAYEFLQNSEAAENLILQNKNVRIEKKPESLFNLSNLCANNDELFLTCDIWTDIHPLITNRKIDWPVFYNYGVVYEKNCNETIRLFVNTIKAILAEMF